MLNTIELTPEQSKEIINVHQLFGVYQERMSHASHFKGSMSWKNIDVFPMNKFRGFFGFKQHMEVNPHL